MAYWNAARNSHRPLCTWAGAYFTYGDGLVQHSPDWPVQAESLGDFCASLATHLLSHPEDTAMVAGNWPQEDRYSRETITFLAGLKYQEEKQRWYSLRDNKVSASESKRHDKRWEKIQTWCDGSMSSVLAMLEIGNHHFLSAWLIAHETYGILQGLKDYHRLVNLHEHFKLTEVGVENAFLAAHHLVLAQRQRDLGTCLLDCYTRDREDVKRREEQAAAPAQEENAAPMDGTTKDTAPTEGTPCVP
jgi:hypothetical protein